MATTTPTGIPGLDDLGRAAGTAAGNIAGAAGNAAGQAASGLPGGSALLGATKVFETLSDPGIWKRIGVIALGVWLVWIGVAFMLAQTRVVRDAIGVGTGALTKGLVK